MLLSDEEKKIIEAIASGKLSTIDDFVEGFVPHRKVVANNFGSNWAAPGTLIPMVDSEFETMKLFVSFMGLCGRLEDESLVYIDKKHPLRSGPYIAIPNKDVAGDKYHQQSGWITRYCADNNISAITVIPDRRLNDFMAAGHKTLSELSKEREETHREKTLFTTRLIACVSIGVSVLVAAATLWFNTSLASSQKTVTVANMPNFSCVVPK